MEETLPLPALRTGPGSQPVQTDTEFKSSLDGASEYEYVDIFNPLSMEFVAQLATSRPANFPTKFAATQATQNESDLRHNYGLNLKNLDRQGNLHVINRVSLMPGQTKRFMGNEAQVIVRQLITELIQQRDKHQFIADPATRTEIEQEIIMGRGDIRTSMESGPQTVQDQLRRAMEDNTIQPTEDTREEALTFPDARTAPGTDQKDSGSLGDPKSTRGRKSTSEPVAEAASPGTV